MVDYVFTHPYGWLVAYHFHVMAEMNRRGYRRNPMWEHIYYRGEKAPSLHSESWVSEIEAFESSLHRFPIYPEHDAAYLQECLDNLARKGIKIDLENRA